VVWIHAQAPHEIRFTRDGSTEGPLAAPLGETLAPLLGSSR